MTDQIQIVVQHVAIDPFRARELFDLGEDVGDWGWRHRTWRVPLDQLAELQAAARFFYGWSESNEKSTFCPDGAVIFEAFYTC